MPVLDPHPQGGQKKLLQMLGLIAAIVVVIAVVATFANAMG
ncbi:SGM_5486 family transporter-associated protein [Kitasatospora phosalacinea]|nr:SGM_5486 family transporter-associated protein [Kitasatospora phosalacinea]